MMKINLLETIRFTTATLERISPRMALWWVSRLFFSPRRGRQEKPELPDLEQRWLGFTAINGSQSKCRIYSSGTGPVVLLIHDRKDRVVPYSHAEAFSSAWPGARLFDTHSLGHSRILRDEEVIQVIASRIWPGENWEQSKNCPAPRFPAQCSRAL